MSSQQSINQVPSQQQSSRFPNSDYSNVTFGLSLIPSLFALLMIFIFFKHSFYQKSLYNKSEKLKKLSENRCYKCKFYSDNQYFQCAVQPSLVLTPQASDCQDFSPKYIKNWIWSEQYLIIMTGFLTHSTETISPGCFS